MVAPIYRKAVNLSLTELEELYDKKIECPICKNEFNTKIVRASRLRLVKRDEDFLSYYNVENPIKYNAFVCPNCGYSAYHSKFDEIKENQTSLIKDNITSKWKKRSFGGVRDLDEAIEAYKLALINGNLLKASNLEIGNILLNLGWLYRLKNEEENEYRFLTLCRDKFIDAYNLESLAGTNMDDSKLSYLIGELSRRINDKEKSILWFNTCMNLPSTRMNPTINNMVREQWRMVKEEN